MPLPIDSRWPILAFGLIGALGPGPASAIQERLVSGTTVKATWRAVIEGGFDRERTWENHASGTERVTSLSRDVYRARVAVALTVAPDGAVTGSGVGRYTEAAWHLEGLNGARGRFSCDPAVLAPPFTVDVSGRETFGRIVLDVRLDAHESNQSFACGAGYEGYATQSSFLADSWSAVGGRSLAVDPRTPSMPPLHQDDRTATSAGTEAVRHSWRVTVTRTDVVPSRPPAEHVAVTTPVRAELVPKGIGRAPTRDECTIVGTDGPDVLTGTRGPDVICGLGGDDIIGGLGGDDIIAGGSGRDVLAPGPGRDRVLGGPGDDRVGGRDGRRDLVNGGPGLDELWSDSGLDHQAAVETLH